MYDFFSRTTKLGIHINQWNIKVSFLLFSSLHHVMEQIA